MSIQAWIEDNDITAEMLTGKSINKMYDKYISYERQHGEMPLGYVYWQRDIANTFSELTLETHYDRDGIPWSYFTKIETE